MGNIRICSPPLKITDVKADGNCGFRAFSFLLFGNELHHWLLRRVITRWRALFMSDQEAQKQWKLIEHMKEQPVGYYLWMGVMDMIAFAQMFLINVICYSEMDNEPKWLCYSPATDQAKNKFVQQKIFPDCCLYFSRNHYSPVVKISELDN